jgi:hypothetical protein
VVLGPREVAAGTVTLRERGGQATHATGLAVEELRRRCAFPASPG